MNCTRYLIAILLLFPLLGNGQELPTGEIIPRVTCLEDSSQHYALFVPSGYTPERAWPVIFFFEPAARAMLPLERYSGLAERFGYITLCSWNSRNGPNEPIFAAANAMYADAFTRFNLDKGRACLSGFSGGARISCLIALSNPYVKAVIGCGAGFPYSRMPEEEITFDYCGIIGRQDMNYQELLLLDSTLEQRSASHLLLTFPEGHRWPDTNTFRSAFYWLETGAMRSGKRTPDEGLLKQIRSDYDSRTDSLRRVGDPFGLARELKNAILLLDGLADVSGYRGAYNELTGSEEYREALRRHYTGVATESGYHQRYWSEFEQISLRALDPDHPIKSRSWWKKEFRKVDELQDADLRARLREFMINGSWEQHINSLRANRYLVAHSYLDVYESGLPDDPSPDYYRARIHALSGDPAAMYRSLENAVDKGFTTPGTIRADEAFREYMGQGKMGSLLAEMKEQD